MPSTKHAILSFLFKRLRVHIMECSTESIQLPKPLRKLLSPNCPFFSPIILLEMYEFSSHALANAPNIVGQKHSSLHASTVLSEVAAARCCWFACPQFPTGLWLINIRSLSCLLRVLDVRYGIWLRVDTERGLIHLILRPPPPTPPAAGLVCSSRPSVKNIDISKKFYVICGYRTLSTNERKL